MSRRKKRKNRTNQSQKQTARSSAKDKAQEKKIIMWTVGITVVLMLLSYILLRGNF